METWLLIVFLVLTVPVVLASPLVFMAADSGLSGRASVFIFVAFCLAGVYVYGMYKLYYVLKPYAAAIPNGYLWLIVPAWLLWAFIQGRK
jgi:hypothetical protein